MSRPIGPPGPTVIPAAEVLLTCPDANEVTFSMGVTSPPTENLTIGGDEVGVGLCDWYGDEDEEFCRRFDICSGEAGKLRLLNRLMSSADRLWCRWINISDEFSGTGKAKGTMSVNCFYF